MSSSIFDQVKHSLEGVVMTKEEINAYKAEHGVDPAKKDLRPGGKAFKRLPVIMSKRTFPGYLETGVKFCERAKELTGKRLLRDLFTDEIVTQTLDAYYQDVAPATLTVKGKGRKVSQVAQELDNLVPGVHRLRANFAQNDQEELMEQGMNKTEARLAVSRTLGHNRIDMTKGYVPTC